MMHHHLFAVAVACMERKHDVGLLKPLFSTHPQRHIFLRNFGVKKIELKRDGIPYHAQEFKPECESTKENLDVLANILIS